MLSLPLIESEIVDLKRDWSGHQNALKALAAFANTRGGTLILGIEDDGVTVGGFNPSDAEERRITSMVVDQLGITPEVRRLPTPDGQWVLTLYVRPSATLVACGGRYLVRVGASNQDMTPPNLPSVPFKMLSRPGTRCPVLTDSASTTAPSILTQQHCRPS